MKFIKLFAILMIITISLVITTDPPKKTIMSSGKPEFVSRWAVKEGSQEIAKPSSFASFINPNSALQLNLDDECYIELAAQQYCLKNSRSLTYVYFTELFQQKKDIPIAEAKWADLHNQKHIFEVILPAIIGSLNFQTDPLILFTGTQESRWKENAAYLDRLSKVGQSSAGDKTQNYISNATKNGDTKTVLKVGTKTIAHGQGQATSALGAGVGAAQTGIGLLGKAFKEFTMLALNQNMMAHTDKKASTPKVQDNKSCVGSSNQVREKNHCGGRRKY